DGGDFTAESGAAEELDYRLAYAGAVDYDGAVAEGADDGNDGNDALDHLDVRGAEGDAFEVADQEVLARAFDDRDSCMVAAFAEVDADVEHLGLPRKKPRY